MALPQAAGGPGARPTSTSSSGTRRSGLRPRLRVRPPAERGPAGRRPAGRATRARPRASSAGSDEAPWAAPSSAPAMAATVSVSSPACTAATSDVRRAEDRRRPGADRRPGGLEGGDDEAVGLERGRRTSSRRPRSRPPTAPVGASGRSRRVPAQSGSAPSSDGQPDARAPQHARVAGERVVVGQPADTHVRRA